MKLLRAIARKSLLVLPFLIYLLTLLLLLSELDRQYYQRAKEDLIKYNFRALFPHDTLSLREVSEKMLVEHDTGGIVAPDLATAWRQLAGAMLDGEGCVFRIRIVPKEGAQIIEAHDRAKFRRLNRFSNTLFYRNFENVVSYEIVPSAEETWTGLLSFHYTTPEHYAPIVSLTNRYRLWALLIAAAVTAGYALVMRRLVLPTRRVVDRINVRSAPTASRSSKIMPQPASILEKAYNDLARDAMLLRLDQSIRSLAAENATLDRSAVLARVPELLVELLDCRTVLVFDLMTGDTGLVSVAGCIEASRDAQTPDRKPYCTEHLFSPEAMPDLIQARRLVHDDCVACDITPSHEPQYRTVLVMFPSPDALSAEAGVRDWHLQTADLAAEQLRERLEAFELQRRYMRQEKGRANISLARNLGHDLTNIIATSRLDILSLMKMREKAPAAGQASAGIDTLFADTLQGLLNNTRLLQEVVNIYRSFSYLSRPHMETAQLNTLLDELLDLFALSLPGRTAVQRDYDAALPPCTVEPRPLKLALFNLLTNAVTAIKQHAGPDRADGVITVATHHESDTGEVHISIRDNGTGILTRDGRIASQAEVDQIFRYGFTTKTEDGSEGLGLSWVWTIIEDFHHGRIAARNHPDGGAEFTLVIGGGRIAGREDERSETLP